MAVTILKSDVVVSVSDFASKIAKMQHHRVLFRGQNIDRPLLPKIARHPNLSADKLERLERQMLERFKRESAPFLHGVNPASDWDWLSIAQHQGMPTRLLDWSSNSLVALWFAVATDPPEKEPGGVVWALEVNDRDLTSVRARDDVFQLGKTRVFQPFHIDRRIAAQAGWFSVHKYSESASKFVPLDQHRTYKQNARRFSIAREHFPEIRKVLGRMGITQATLFPDLSGLCADIQSQFLRSQRPANTI